MVKVTVFALCLGMIACSKSSDAPKAEPAATPPAPVAADASTAPIAVDAAPVPDAPAGEFSFDKLERPEKIDFMKKKVVPRMKKLFQDFDAKEYAVFGCKTCHGKDPQGTKYKMPSADLPKLDFAALEAGKQEPEVAEFMSKVVKPEMAKLLGEREYSPANPNGFGCLACHEEKK